MTAQLQFLTAPDGSRLAVLPADEYDRLVALSSAVEARLDDADAAAAPALIEKVANEGTVPAEVVDLMLDHGYSAVKAWRVYRGFNSTAALAKRTGLSQPFISKIERGVVYGTRETRKKLADALNAPLWALDDE